MQHPLIVHLPIALAVVMPILALGFLAAWWKGALPRRVWSIAIVLQAMLVGAGLAAFVVLGLGDRAGTADRELVHRHGAAAVLITTTTGGGGALPASATTDRDD